MLWPVTVDGVELEFNALNMTDIGTTLTELARIDSKESPYIAMRFENEWLSRYPHPERII